MATVDEVKKLRTGDYIEASDLYYKVLGVNKKGLTLTQPFPLGNKPEGRWFYPFDDEVAGYDFHYWRLIPENSPEAKKIERQKQRSSY